MLLIRNIYNNNIATYIYVYTEEKVFVHQERTETLSVVRALVFNFKICFMKNTLFLIKTRNLIFNGGFFFIILCTWLNVNYKTVNIE